MIKVQIENVNDRFLNLFIETSWRDKKTGMDLTRTLRIPEEEVEKFATDVSAAFYKWKQLVTAVRAMRNREKSELKPRPVKERKPEKRIMRRGKTAKDREKKRIVIKN